MYIKNCKSTFRVKKIRKNKGKGKNKWKKSQKSFKKIQEKKKVSLWWHQ